MNEPTITVTRTVTNTRTTTTVIELTEDEVAKVLQQHFSLPEAVVEFHCTSYGAMRKVVITDTQCTEETLHDA